MNISSTGRALALIRSLLDTTKRTLAPLPFSAQKPEYSGKSERFFARVSPEQCGVDSDYVAEFADRLAHDGSIAFRNIMLLRNGRVFFETASHDCDPSVWQTTFSECKSVVSLAIGSLVTEGKLSLSDRVAEIFDEKTLPVSKLRLKNLTVRHLLTMTSTVDFNEAEAMVTRDWIRAFMNSTTQGEIGKTFSYNSLNTYMLSAIIKKVTGMGISEYLDGTVFGALGITDYYWEKCPLGIEKGGWGLYILPEDMAKLGLLVMQRGVWGGKRIISREYLSEATRTQAIAPRSFGDYNYGYQMWCGRTVDSFLFNGMLGQNVLGFYDTGIIVVTNCGNGDNFQQSPLFRLVSSYFQRSFPDALPENPRAEKRLAELSERISSVVPAKRRGFLTAKKYAVDLDADLRSLDGMRLDAISPNSVSVGLAPLFLQGVQNNYSRGLLSVSFGYENGAFSAVFEEEDESNSVRIGFSSPERSRVSFHGEPWLVSAFGVFAENEDNIPVLKFTVNFLETPYSRVYKFFFDGNTVTGEFVEAPGTAYARSAPRIMLDMLGKKEILTTVYSKIDSDYISVKLEKAFAPKVIFRRRD